MLYHSFKNLYTIRETQHFILEAYLSAPAKLSQIDVYLCATSK
ncbi:unnamed protein product [Rhodiola kirilowii]